MPKRQEQLLEAFGGRVRELRVSRRLSQEQLAAKAVLDRTYISGIELGRRNVALINLNKLAGALDVSLSTLFEGL